MSDPAVRRAKRCNPGCICGRHKQHRWTNLTVESRFWSKVERGNPDECWLWTAGLGSTGYGSFCLNNRDAKAHRVAYELSVGPIEPGMVIDHRCFNRLCVNPGHLRAVTRKQNNENLQGARRNSRSGIRGVYQRPNGRWCAEVRHNGRRIHIGYFASIEDAETAVVAKRLELHTHNDLDRSV